MAVRSSSVPALMEPFERFARLLDTALEHGVDVRFDDFAALVYFDVFSPRHEPGEEWTDDFCRERAWRF